MVSFEVDGFFLSSLFIFSFFVERRDRRKGGDERNKRQ